jgi:microcystin-dependent protein
MPFFRWSRTAATNATADSSCPFPEGMAPSALNDGNRAMMARIREYGDDIAGAIVTTGTSSAYAVSSYEGFDALTSLNGQMIAFTPNATNGATVTLNVDGLGAKPLRTAPGTELLAGVLIQGTPYVATYNNSDGAFYLQSFFGNPYNIPLGGGMDYWLASTPNSSFALAYGQAISRTTYAALFSLMSTTYGAGDGSTTFNLPDVRGRVTAKKDDLGGASANRLSSTYFGGNPTVFGATGGSEAHTLTTGEMPSHYHTATISDPGHSHVTDRQNGLSPTVGTNSNTTNALVTLNNGQTGGSLTGVRVNSSNGLDSTNSTGGGAAHAIVQPTIICSYILRIL